MANVRARMTGRSSPLLEAHRFLRRGPVSAQGWSQLAAKDRAWERSYRGRWEHDKIVRSTHGVNCTGSCSWQVFVKDGLITWESQAVDYPATGPEMHFALQDHAQLMASAPLVYQLHALSAWAIFALWPFSPLLHAWSVPVQYLGRPYILYRRRFQASPQ